MSANHPFWPASPPSPNAFGRAVKALVWPQWAQTDRAVSHKSAKSTAIQGILVQTFSGLRDLRLGRRLLSLQWGGAAHVPIV
jgi:hypothetical protein